MQNALRSSESDLSVERCAYVQAMARSLCLALCAASAAAWVLPAAPAARVARRRSVPAMTTEDAEWEAELSKRLESKARVSSDVHPVYCENVYRATRRKTRTVWAGQVPIGSEHRIARQTMTTTDTNDVEATVQQTIRCADAGADLVRITVQGRREAEACKAIRERLTELGYAHVALVADIHFQPKVALLVAEAFEKIRVNPGNFADGRKSFEEIDYDDPAQFEEERAAIEETFTPLVLKCKELGRAMRIGTNHGSLSARIMSYYGDSAAGMVASAVEFADICRKHDYHNFVFSMKASNPLVMAQAYRLLASEMYKREWDYPLHLGVTEAGEGEDGRMKSSIGIGALLHDGLGDTIRVSLTEDPEFELKPCGKLAELGEEYLADPNVPAFEEGARNFAEFARRRGQLPLQRASDATDVRNVLHRDGSVLSAVSPADLKAHGALYDALGAKQAVGMPFRDIATSDSLFLRELPDDKDARTALRRLQEVGVGVLAPAPALAASPLAGAIAVVPLAELAAADDADALLPEGAARLAVSVRGDEDAAAFAALAKAGPGAAAVGVPPEESVGIEPQGPVVMALLEPPADVSYVHAARRAFELLSQQGADGLAVPVIHHLNFAGDRAIDDRDEMVRARARAPRAVALLTPSSLLFRSVGDAHRRGRGRPAHRRARRRRAARGAQDRARLHAHDELRAAAGLPHAQHQDGVRLVPFVRPHALRPAGGDRQDLRGDGPPAGRDHRGDGLHRQRARRDGRRRLWVRRRRAGQGRPLRREGGREARHPERGRVRRAHRPHQGQRPVGREGAGRGRGGRGARARVKGGRREQGLERGETQGPRSARSARQKERDARVAAPTATCGCAQFATFH